MSKKLIAIASAAALALSALVAAPAMSAGANLTILPVADSIGGVVTGSGLTSTTAFEVAVPSKDVLRSTATVSNRSALALEISTRSNNAAVAVTSTGAVKLLTAAQLAATTTTTATGTQSLALTANDSGKVTFYAYNTSTSAGSITVVESGTTPASNTVWVKGTTAAINAYTLNVTAPTTAGLGSKVEYTATVVDMFGNAVESIADLAHTTLGGDASATAPATNMSWNATKKLYEGSFTNRTTAGPVALLVSLTTSADAVTALGAKTSSVFVNVNGADLQAANATLQAQIVTLTATIANMRTKDRSVTLKRWNNLVKRHRALGGSAKLK